MVRAYWLLILVGCGGGGEWRAKVPPKYMEVAEIHHASCGGCHTRVEPGQRTRDKLEKALAKHHKRVKMTDAQWAQLIDYLSETP